MKRNRRPLLLLLTAIVSLCLFAIFVLLFSPNMMLLPLSLVSGVLPFHTNGLLQIPSLLIFFLLLGVFLFSFGSYLFKSKKHGVLIAGFVLIYLLFRLKGLTHPLFLFLLAALFLTLELMVANRRD